MIIQKLGSATVLIKTIDINILCDPWLTDGAYYGSWCNFPPIDLKKYNLKDIDFIYISHIHPDHFDIQTMHLLDKSIPVLIHKYHKKFLKLNIQRLGFKVIELENATQFNLSSKTKITIYAADNCDPTKCGKMFGCITPDIKGSMQLDSLCLIDDGSFKLVNTNDCPYGIAEQTLKRLKLEHDKIDFSLIGYTSASLFPHCMINYDDKKMSLEINNAIESGLNRGLKTLKVLKSEYYMPFAGTYIIGGNNFKKNNNLPLPEIQDAVKYYDKELSINSINSKGILLNLGEYFNLNSKKTSAPYQEISIKERNYYIQNIASKFKYDFEEDEFPNIQELINLFEASLIKLKLKQDELMFFEDIDLIFDLPSEKYGSINLSNTKFNILENFSNLKNYHRFQLDPRLLKRVLKGPKFANWNNIEIGSLLNFDRKPDIYRMDLHILLNSLHV